MNPFRSIAAKISLLTSLLALGIIALMSHGVLRQIETGLVGEMRVRAEFFARSAREAVFPKLDPFSLHFHVEELLKEKAVTYAAVVDAQGRVLSHSDPRFIGEVLDDPMSRRARAAEQILLQRRTEAGGGQGYELAVPLTVGSRRVGTARLGFDDSSIRGALKAQKRRLFLLAALAMAASILGTTLIVGWITRPLPRLAAAAAEIGRGNFDVRVDWQSRDEVGALSRAFNDMAVANSILFTAIRQEKEKLATIFHETREGMMWTDHSGRVLMLNPSARALLGCAETPGHLRDALNGFESSPSAEKVLAPGARLTPVEFRRADPKLLILSGVADRLGTEKDPAGLLFVFHDATLEKRGEGLARNFLSIVSHKLRTPLAVALGYLDILLGDGAGLGPEQRRMMEKIRTQDEQLSSLVEKLIAFTVVQNPGSIVLERAPMLLADVVAEAIKSFPEALGEGVTLLWKPETAAGLPPLDADATLLKGVVANLLENAVKFNRSPRKEVEVAVAPCDEGLRLSVRDNGPGIPSEEQPKLFRRFYQIDDDFTGQVPGFGLGLAYVKNVAEAHGGRAGFLSEPGRGSEFYVILPLPAARRAS
ncbi:MAG: HAMP domain-containing protein [Elusimicrobia bacterium]|nr:HAMP domain-containing protein [Elusimicrobiota bacterium]MDE2511409.1 HAMP domain-containing protein [Elusimicrobiota bacterium]